MPKILAIDDINDNLISLKAIVHDAFPGSVVFTALNGPEGIELAHSADPDVILLDVIMPGMDGFEVCQLLKQHELTRDIPVVFVTAIKGDKESRIKALEAGAEGFLSKPIDEIELTAKIRAMVKIKQGSEQKRNEKERLTKLVAERTVALQNELKERMNAEIALSESEVRFRHISTSISDICYSCKIDSDGNSQIDWLYGATEKITGYTIGELIEMKCWGKIVVSEDFPIFKSHILGALPGTSEVCQLRLRKKDGSLVWIEATAEFVKGPDGEGFGATLYGGLVDITGRKQLETELIAAKEKAEASEQQILVKNTVLIERNSFIQTVLDNLPIGIALNKINEGTATYMNKRFEEIYGWNSEEIISIGIFFEHVYPDAGYRNKLIGQIMADIQSGDPSRMHWENIFVTRKDGSKRVVNAVNIPLTEQNTMVSTVIDITELNKTQNNLIAAKEKAEESDHLKSAFLANMSHEIRTPLNSIIGFSELMADPDFDHEQQLEFARMINESGTNLLSIITDIMDISKIEAKQVQVKRELFSVNHLIAAIQKEYSYKAEKKGIELRLDPSNPMDIITIESDETKLRQVLVNLVGNAIKFTKEGFVGIGIKAVGNQVQFHVQDTGIGIPTEYHQQIFERFRQVEAFDTRRYGGNGLGLAISKSLVELLGGKIWLESEVGNGSTFYFSVPN